MSSAHSEDFARQTELLRTFLRKWSQSLEQQWHQQWQESTRPSSSPPPPLDWSLVLGKLTSLQSQLQRLNEAVDPVLRHFVYVPVRAPSDPRDVKTFLMSTVAAIATDDEGKKGQDEGDEMDEGGENRGAAKKEDPVRTLINMQLAVEEVVDHFNQHKDRF